jgi:glucuronosyltransferase
MVLKLILLFLFSFNCGQGANILGLYFHAGKSHHILGEMLLKELARRGHNVTMASPFPLAQPFPNYTDIHLTGIVEDQLGKIY